MANTTISISKQFRDWLKSKGSKRESYEDIIKRLLKPDALEEYKAFKPPEDIIESGKKETKEQSDVVDTMFGGELI